MHARVAVYLRLCACVFVLVHLPWGFQTRRNLHAVLFRFAHCRSKSVFLHPLLVV